MIAFKTSVYFYHGGAWVLCSDVLQDPPPSWGFGLPDNGPMDLVADTGILTFTLDNTTSNSAGLSGYYSTGHPNCPAWFVDGLRIKVVCERQDTFASATRFLGEMVDARPTSGVFEEATVEVEAHDWMEYVSIQKLGQLAIQTSKRVDQALTTALLNFPATRQPAATDFDVGNETFASIFNTDDSMKQTMASLFQKLARNECAGYIFLEGDGTLRFDNRNTRPATTTSAFTLDATGVSPMNELEVEWDRKSIKNRIEVKMFPSRVDTSAVSIWKLQKPFPLSLGQTLVLTCPYRDPATGARISATNVVDPLVEATHIKFGTTDDGTSHDIHTYTRAMDVGGNTAEITLVNENKGATVNCAKNPSSEVNVTDDWTAQLGGVGGSINLDATQYKVGAKSMRIRASNSYAAAASTAGVSVANGASVVGSGWIRCSASPAGGKAKFGLTVIGVVDYASGGPTDASILAWEYVTVSWTNNTGSAKLISLQCYNGFADSAADVWFDACQLELAAAATPYCDGTLYDCTWSGTAHNSTSSRPAGQAGYVNFIELFGKGIYTYEPMVIASEDIASIALRGERVLPVNLEQLAFPNTAETYAASLKTLLATPVLGIERVRFLANFSDAFATAALTLEVNTRFTIAEEQTYTITDVFACRLKYEQVGPLLWVEIVPAPAGADVNYFIYDLAGHGYDQGRYTI